MSRIAQLYDLQQIDSVLDSRVARIRQIDEQMAESQALLAARAAIEEASAHLASEQARLKKASHDVEDTSTRLRTQEKRLYDGSVKNPKELGQIQEEVWHLKSRLKEQEDLVLDAMMAVEEAEATKQARQDELNRIEQEWRKYQDGLIEEKDTLVSQLKVLQVKRQRSMTEVPWADLQTYERLRRAKTGLAVAVVREGRCSGCHTSVPAHVLRMARSSADFVPCPTCARLLYPIGGIKYEEFDHDLDNVDR